MPDKMIPVNSIICGDCLEVMKDWPDNCVDLVVTSPPYYNLKAYSSWNSYKDYLEFINYRAKELFRILKVGRHLFWNIQHGIPTKIEGSAFRNTYPLTANTEIIFMDVGFCFEGLIIWDKGIGGATQKMFGSYPYPPTIIPSFRTEDILLFRKNGKPDLSRKSEVDKISKQEWVTIATNLWRFSTDRSPYHPALFPIQLPLNCLKCWSFTNDIILDPFNGFGTTCLAAKVLGRRYIGIDISEKYCEIARQRLEAVDTGVPVKEQRLGQQPLFPVEIE